MANEFVVRNGLIVSGSTYLEAISQSNEAYILSYDSVTNEVAYMPTSSVVVTVPGADTQIIYNNGGVFGASSNLVFSGSRVGIGSANPAYTLDVVGAVNASGGFRTSDNVFTNYIRDTSGVKYISLDGTGIKLEPAGYGQTVLQAVSTGVNITGNVGIGSTNPSSRLTVAGEGSGSVRMGNTGFGGDWVGISLSGNLNTTDYNLLSSATNASFYLNRPNGGDILFRHNNVDQMIIKSGGNVGIGTTNPSYKLDVNGGSASSPFRVVSTNTTSLRTFLEATSGNVEQHFLYTGNQDWVLGLDKADSNKFKLASADDGFASAKLTVTTGGSVGIGTTNPQYKLDLSGSFRVDGTNGDFIVDATGNDVYFTRNGTNYFYANQASSAISFQLGAGYSQSLFLKNDGNVGVGTASPAAKLDLAYSTNPTTATPHIILTTGGTSKQAAITAESFAVGGLVFSTGDGTLVNRMTITRTDGNVGIGITNPSHKLTVLGAVSASSFTGSFSGTSTNAISASFAATASSADDFYVRGSVGIGITNPSQKLVVSGNTSVTGVVYSDVLATYGGTSIDFRNQSAESIMYLDATNKRAGIGTTNPAYKLDVQGSAGNIARITDGTSHFLFYAGSGLNEIATTGPFLFTVSGSERMRITTSGNVGIGTTNPLSKLQVNKSSQAYTSPTASGALVLSDTGGTGAVLDMGVNTTYLSYIQSRYLDNSSVYQLLLNPGGGSVGIGTTSPGYTLDVNGVIQSKGYVATGNYDGPASVPNTGIFSTNVTFPDGFGSLIVAARPDAARPIVFATYNGSAMGERMRINSAGSVGIGTSAPTAKLDINGDTLVTGSVKIAAGGGGAFELWDVGVQRAYIGMTGTPGLNLASDAEIQFQPGNATAVTFASSGNVGIGTTNPTAQLTLSKGAGNQMLQLINSSESGFKLHIHNSGSANTGEKVFTQYLGYNDNVNGYISFHRGSSGTDGYLSFGDNGGERVRFSNGGNVGIGTTSSGYKLEVNGTQRVVDNFYLYNTVTNVASNFTNQRGFGFDASTGATEIAASTVPLQLSRFSTTGDVLTIRHSGSVVSSLRTDGGASFTGNVGIGINSPSYKLHVSGGNTYMDGNLTVTGAITAQELYVQYISSSIIYSTGSNKFGDATNDIQYFTGSILQSGSLAYFAGNVGIGTASPTRQLELAGSDAYIQLTRSSTSTQATLGFNTGATNDWLIRTGDGSTSDLQFYSYGNSSYVMTIARSSGNVGIGTATPNYKLEVSGSTNVYHRLDVGTGIDFPAGTSNAIATFKQAGSTGGIILQEAGGTSNDRILKLNSNGDEQSIEATYRDTGPYGNLAFKTGGSTRMYISSSGNIGIGTTTVYNRLHVVASGTTLMSGSAGRGITVTDTTGPRLVLENPSAASNTRNWVIKNDLGFLSFSLLDDQGTAWIVDNAVNIVPSGNLGIGTTSPAQKLQVNGSVALNTTTDGTSRYYTYPDANHAWFYDDNIVGSSADVMTYYENFLVRHQDTTNVFLINGSGNVGIGTTNPTLKLDVVGNARIGQTSNSSTDAKIELTSGGSGYNAFIDYGFWNTFDASLWRAGVFGDDGSKFKIQNTGAGPVYDVFVINGTSTFAFLTGSVGIGTASPGAKLQITGGTLDGASLTDLGISSGLTTGRLGTFDANSLASISTRGDASSVELAAGSSATYYTGISATANNATSFTGTLRFFTSGSEKVRITPSGNVGIGTTSPAEKLAVVGNIRAGGNVVASAGLGDGNFISMRHDDTNGYITITRVVNAGHLILEPYANVGIGTTNPAYKLDVRGAINSSTATTSGTGSLNLGTTAESIIAGQILGTRSPSYASTGKLGFSVSTWGVGSDYGLTEVMAIDMRGADSKAPTIWMNPFGGNVGIGTTSPTQILHLARTGTDNYIKVDAGGQASNYSGIMLSEAGINYGWTLRHSALTDLLYISYQDNTPTFTDAVTFNRSGYVGIGTQTPAAKLDISSGTNSNALFIREDTDNSITHNLWIDSSDNGNFWMYANGQDVKIALNTAGNSYLNGGNVGIGTTNPTEKLHIVEGSSAVGIGEYSNGAIIWMDGSNGDFTGGDYFNIWTPSETRTSIGYAGGEALTVTSGSRVGIGTTSPNGLLEVYSTTNTTARIKSAGASGSAMLTINPEGAGAGSVGDGVVFFDMNSTAWAVGVDKSESSTFKIANDVYGNFSTNNYFNITTGGNVGIGTTSPATKFHVHGYTTIDSVDVVATFSSDNTAKRVNIGYSTSGDYGFINAVHTGVAWKNLIFGVNGGNVGIGTTSPEARLTVNGGTAGSSATMVAFNNGANAQRIDIIDEGSAYGQGTGLKTGTGFGLRLWASAGPVSLNTGGGSTIALMATGSRIGIGTIDPGATLDVNGNVYVRPGNGLFTDSIYGYSTNLVSVGNSGNPTNFNVPSGNVGIGTTSPDTRLHVWNGNSGGAPYEASGITIENSGRAALNFLSGAGNDAYVFFGNSSAGNAGYVGYENTNNNLVLRSSDYISLLDSTGTVVRIDGGNVGIGTTNPSQKLSVVGDFAIANTTSIQESRIGKYQSGSLGSGTHTIASVSVTGVDAVFFDYVIKNSTTDMRAGTVMAVTNGSTVEYTDISTADIGDTTRITMISDVSGGNIRLRASIDTGSGSWTVRTLIRTI